MRKVWSFVAVMTLLLGVSGAPSQAAEGFKSGRFAAWADPDIWLRVVCGYWTGSFRTPSNGSWRVSAMTYSRQGAYPNCNDVLPQPANAMRATYLSVRYVGPGPDDYVLGSFGSKMNTANTSSVTVTDTDIWKPRGTYRFSTGHSFSALGRSASHDERLNVGWIYYCDPVVHGNQC